MTTPDPVQLGYYVPARAQPLKDCSGRLMAAGILLLLVAVLPLYAVFNEVRIVIGFRDVYYLMYMLQPLLIAALLCTSAIGAIRRRRWSRPVIIATYWIFLVGFSAFVLYAFCSFFRIDSDSDGSSIHLLDAIFILAGMAIANVVPLIIFMLVRSNDVKSTLEFYDTMPRWTDQSSPQLIAFILGLGLIGLKSATSLSDVLIFPSNQITSLMVLHLLTQLFIFAGCLASAWLLLRNRRLGITIAGVTAITYAALHVVLPISTRLFRSILPGISHRSVSDFEHPLRWMVTPVVVSVVGLIGLVYIKKTMAQRLT